MRRRRSPSQDPEPDEHSEDSVELTPNQQRLVDYVREHPGELVVSTLGKLSMNQKEFWNDVSILCERGVLEKRAIEGRKHEGLWVA